MLHVLQIKNTENLVIIRPKTNQKIFKPFILTFEKSKDAQKIRYFISGRDNIIYYHKNKVLFAPTNIVNPKWDLEENKITINKLINTNSMLGHDLFITESINLDYNIVLNGFIYEIHGEI
jgi:hypothetical protein